MNQETETLQTSAGGWRELSAIGSKPFIAFTTGVAVTMMTGFVLSVLVFGSYSAALEQ
jgi:hypothetical protein